MSRDLLSSSLDDGVPQHTVRLDASVYTPPGPADSVVQYHNIAVLTPAVHGLNAQTLSETAFVDPGPEIHLIMLRFLVSSLPRLLICLKSDTQSRLGICCEMLMDRGSKAALSDTFNHIFL
eukprot:scaffold6672_cov135-Alexandrium_tamarense.AAC.2